MENPGAQTRAEQIVGQVIKDYYGRFDMCPPDSTLALPQVITDALQAAGLLTGTSALEKARKALENYSQELGQLRAALAATGRLPESLWPEAAKRSCGDPDCDRPDHQLEPDPGWPLSTSPFRDETGE
jgi:hypothetical protein